MFFSLFLFCSKRENIMLTNQVPSLQAIIIAKLSPDILNSLNVVLPEPPTLKEQTNIRVLGTCNPIKIVTDEELIKEKYKRQALGVSFCYIHPASTSFGNKSPRTMRIGKREPERRLIIEHNARYTKVEFYDYYYYDRLLAQKKWEDAEERTDPEDSDQTYTKHQFYDFYKNKKTAELEWNLSQPIRHTNKFL